MEEVGSAERNDQGHEQQGELAGPHLGGTLIGTPLACKCMPDPGPGPHSFSLFLSPSPFPSLGIDYQLSSSSAVVLFDCDRRNQVCVWFWGEVTIGGQPQTTGFMGGLIWVIETWQPSRRLIVTPPPALPCVLQAQHPIWDGGAWTAYTHTHLTAKG